MSIRVLSFLSVMCVFTLCEDARAIERSCVPNCAGILDLAGSRTADELGGLARLIRPKIEEASAVADRVKILNQFYFEILKFQPEDATDPNNAGLLPEEVLRNRRGSCVGLAGIYLALAQLLGMPAAAVGVPNHVFVRFEAPGTRLNVELLQAGKNFDDDWYARVHHIPQSSIVSGVFLRSLSDREFLGEIYASLGATYSKLGDYTNSRVLYQAAMKNAPLSPWAPYDLGNDLMKQGFPQEAMRMYDESLSLYPSHVRALNNRGLAHCHVGNEAQARKDYEAALAIDPAFAQARENLRDLRCERLTPQQQ